MTGRKQTMRGSRVGLPFAVLLAALSWLLAGVMLWAGAAPALDHHAVERNPRHSHLSMGASSPAPAMAAHTHGFEFSHPHNQGIPTHPHFGVQLETPPGLVAIAAAPDTEPSIPAGLAGKGSMAANSIRSSPPQLGPTVAGGSPPPRGAPVAVLTPPPKSGLV